MQPSGAAMVKSPDIEHIRVLDAQITHERDGLRPHWLISGPSATVRILDSDAAAYVGLIEPRPPPDTTQAECVVVTRDLKLRRVVVLEMLSVDAHRLKDHVRLERERPALRR